MGGKGRKAHPGFRGGGFIFGEGDSDLVALLASRVALSRWVESSSQPCTHSGQNLINSKRQLLAISDKNFLEHKREAILRDPRDFQTQIPSS